jgi:hypothetical protein
VLVTDAVLAVVVVDDDDDGGGNDVFVFVSNCSKTSINL